MEASCMANVELSSPACFNSVKVGYVLSIPLAIRLNVSGASE